MFFSSFFHRSQLRRTRHRSNRRHAVRRPSLEVLEDRSLPAFLAPVDYAAGPYAYQVVTANFDGDGRLDLATANIDNDDVSILLGNGVGRSAAMRVAFIALFSALILLALIVPARAAN